MKINIAWQGPSELPILVSVDVISIKELDGMKTAIHKTHSPSIWESTYAVTMLDSGARMAQADTPIKAWNEAKRRYSANKDKYPAALKKLKTQLKKAKIKYPVNQLQ